MNQVERVLLYSSNMWIFADGLLGPLFAIYTQKVGGDIFDITYAVALYLIVTGILVIFIGKYSDKKKNHKELLVLGYLLTAVFTLGYIFVSNTYELFFIQIGLGLALALCNPSWYALYDKYSTKNKEGEVWGLSDGEGKILTGFAVISGGMVVNYLGFNTLFIAMAVIQLLATIYLYIHLRPKIRYLF
jgi:MFS family permease